MMNTEEHTNIRRYTIAAIISMSALYINSLVDGILVGKYISPMAFSAISAMEPVFMLISVWTYLFASGAGILLGKSIGAGEIDSINNRFSVTVGSLFICGAMASLAGSVYYSEIISLVCEDEVVFMWAAEYSNVILSASFLQILSQGFGVLVSVSGHPNVVTKASIASVIVNIAGDIGMFVIGNLGIIGAAWSLVAGVVAANVVFVKFFFSKKNIYSFVKPNNILLCLKENMVYGLPDMMASVSDIAISIILVQFIQFKLGALGMFVLSAVLVVINLGFMIINCVSNAFMNVGAKLIGQKNFKALDEIFIYCIKIDFVIISIVFVICYFFADNVAILFGADSQGMIDLTKLGAKYIFWLFVGIVFTSVLMQIHQIVGEIILSQVESVILIVSAVIIFYGLEPLLCREIIWEMFIGCSALAILCVVVFTEIARHMSLVPRNALSLLPKP